MILVTFLHSAYEQLYVMGYRIGLPPGFVFTEMRAPAILFENTAGRQADDGKQSYSIFNFFHGPTPSQ